MSTITNMDASGVEISYRPMRAEEIEFHAKEIRPLGWRHAIERSFFGFAMTCLPFAFFFDHFPSLKSMELPLILLLFALWTWFCVLYARNPINSSFRMRHLQELAYGRIEISLYHAVAAIKVAELEDEGSNYFVLLCDGSIVFISGQYLYEAEEDGLFPCTEFVVERTGAMKESRDFRPSGNPLPTALTLPSYSLEQLENGQVPWDGEIVPAQWTCILSGDKYLKS
jgi:hypothetical protein